MKRARPKEHYRRVRTKRGTRRKLINEGITKKKKKSYGYLPQPRNIVLSAEEYNAIMNKPVNSMTDEEYLIYEGKIEPIIEEQNYGSHPQTGDLTPDNISDTFFKLIKGSTKKSDKKDYGFNPVGTKSKFFMEQRKRGPGIPMKPDETYSSEEELRKFKQAQEFTALREKNRLNREDALKDQKNRKLADFEMKRKEKEILMHLLPEFNKLDTAKEKQKFIEEHNIGNKLDKYNAYAEYSGSLDKVTTAKVLRHIFGVDSKQNEKKSYGSGVDLRSILSDEGLADDDDYMPKRTFAQREREKDAMKVLKREINRIKAEEAEKEYRESPSKRHIDDWHAKRKKAGDNLVRQNIGRINKEVINELDIHSNDRWKFKKALNMPVKRK